MIDPESDADGATAVREADVSEREARSRAAESRAALARYRERQRRPRIVYAVVVSAVVVVLLGVVVAAWSSGETNNARLRTVADAPGALALATPVSAPTATWRADGRAAIGQPQWNGTVVAGAGRTMRGIDARTGRTTWSYTRSDRTLCTSAQLNGVAIAVYRLHGNCDEVTALDAGTGTRRWTRTLDMDGMPVSGTPVFGTSLQGGFGTLLVRTSSVIYAIDPVTGYNRWTYTRFGCRITGAVLGQDGALVSQTCSRQVQCDQEKFCGVGTQLFLRSAYDGRDDKNATNPDKITWNLIGTSAVPVSADSLVSAVDPSGELLHLDPASGRTLTRTRLASPADGSTTFSAVDAGGTEIVTAGSRTYSIRSGVPTPLWSLAGVATVVAASPSQTPTLGTARITLRTDSGAETVDGTTGRVVGSYSLPGAPTGARVLPLGQGFLVTGSRRLAAFA